VDWLPDAAFDPDQAPEAGQDEALVVLHVSVEEFPLDTLVGLAVKVSVGAGVGAVTVTVTEAWAEPPLPVQLRV
jgi:hypothetical protein